MIDTLIKWIANQSPARNMALVKYPPVVT